MLSHRRSEQNGNTLVKSVFNEYSYYHCSGGNKCRSITRIIERVPGGELRCPAHTTDITDAREVDHSCIILDHKFQLELAADITAVCSQNSLQQYVAALLTDG
jgi:hypothetical protein